MNLYSLLTTPRWSITNARQRDASNGLVFLNKFEGAAEVEHVRRIWIREIAKNKIRMEEFGEITPNESLDFKAIKSLKENVILETGNS